MTTHYTGQSPEIYGIQPAALPNPRTWVKDVEPWVVDIPQGYVQKPEWAGGGWVPCVWEVKVSPWFEVEDEAYPLIGHALADQVKHGFALREAFDTACRIIEEKCEELERRETIYIGNLHSMEDDLMDLAQDRPPCPGPDWHWIPGHWRRYSGKAATPHVEGVTYHDPKISWR